MKPVILTFATVCFSLLINAQTWVQRADIPNSTSRCTGMSSKGKGYIVFGQNSQNINTNSLYEYDPILNAWASKANFPGPGRSNGFSFSINDRVFAGGGYNGTSTFFDFAEYIPDSNIWVSRANFPGTGTRGSKGASLNGKGYVVGGTYNRSIPYSNQMWEYDPITDNWTQKANIPSGATSGAVFFNADSLLFITHGHNSTSMHSNLWAYNPATNTWTQKTSFPGQARLNGTSFEINGKIVVGGGHQLVTTNVLNDYYEYDPVLDIWDTLPLFIGGRRSSAADFTIGKIGYLVGGFDSVVANINTVWTFKPLITSTNDQKIIAANWNVFPNPANESFTLNVNELKGGQYTIFSITGAVQKEGVFNTSTKKINCSELVEGAYFIRLTSNGYQSTKKIMVVR